MALKKYIYYKINLKKKTVTFGPRPYDQVTGRVMRKGWQSHRLPVEHGGDEFSDRTVTDESLLSDRRRALESESSLDIDDMLGPEKRRNSSSSDDDEPDGAGPGWS